MVANLAVVPSTIIEPPRLSGALAKIINQINRLEKTEHDLIALLPSLDWSDLLAARESSRLAQCSAWKIEAACDKEIWDRHEKMAGGRGQIDVEGKGIMAAVNKRAKDIGAGASTIRANARLYKRFETVLSGGHSILEDKGYFQAAQTATDPDAAIEYFEEERGANPHFRPADAWRWVKAQKETEQGPHVDDVVVLQSPAVKEWLENLKATMEDRDELLESMVPFPAHLRAMVRFFNRAVAEQLSRTVEGDCGRIMKVIEDANGLSYEHIEKALQERGYFISDLDLKARIAVMEETKQIVEDSAGKEGKLEASRGIQPAFYVAWYKKREKVPLCKQCGEFHRDDRDCLLAD